MAHTASAIAYRPEIDGLRALAIVPVVLFHIDKSLLPGGYIGVDVFFVISGFLIASIILREHQSGSFSFANFWLRRIRRILPALIVMVMATLTAGSLILYAPDLFNLGNNGLAALLSFANLSHWRLAGNYWGQTAESSPLLHTWSLSVEEQFYLIFPLFLVLALKHFPARLLPICLLLIASSLGLFLLGLQINPAATFYLLPTRAWELGIGTLLALLVHRGQVPGMAYQAALAGIGILLVVQSYVVGAAGSGISGLHPLPVIGAAMVIAYAGSDGGFVTRLLSAAPLVYIGKVSYSLYLWHWPVLVLAQQWATKHQVDTDLFLIVVAMLTLAALSYHLIEAPTRRNAKAVPYILLALLAGLALSYSLRVSERIEDLSKFSPVAWNGSLYSVNPQREWTTAVKKKMAGITVPTDRDEVAPDAYLTGGIVRNYGSATPEIVVLGDSHGLMWGRVLDEAARDLGKSIAFYTADATPAFFAVPPIRRRTGTMYLSADQKLAFDAARLRDLGQWRPRLVVISAMWSNVREPETNDLIRYLGSIGSRVLLIEQPPELAFGDRNAPQYLAYIGLADSAAPNQYVDGANTEAYRRGRELVRSIAAECAYCRRVAVADLFLNNDKVLAIDAGNVLYIDDDHLSQAGANRARERIAAALREQF